MSERYPKIIPKKVRVRKTHICEYCGGHIEAGQYAICVRMWRSRYDKYPEIWYYHALENTDPRDIFKLSPNEWRQRICSQYWNQD